MTTRGSMPKKPFAPIMYEAANIDATYSIIRMRWVCVARTKAGIAPSYMMLDGIGKPAEFIGESLRVSEVRVEFVGQKVRDTAFLQHQR